MYRNTITQSFVGHICWILNNEFLISIYYLQRRPWQFSESYISSWWKALSINKKIYNVLVLLLLEATWHLGACLGEKIMSTLSRTPRSWKLSESLGIFAAQLLRPLSSSNFENSWTYHENTKSQKNLPELQTWLFGAVLLSSKRLNKLFYVALVLNPRAGTALEGTYK